MNIESQLNPNYNFQNFLEGDSNRLARSAGIVANKPGGTSFNPLLIFGNVGLGKTHLAHAIGVKIKDKFPDKTVFIFLQKSLHNSILNQLKKTQEMILFIFTKSLIY